MFLEQIKVEVSLMISLAVNAFQRVKAWFPLFYLKFGQINFEICLATLCKMMLIFTFVRTIALDPLQFLISQTSLSLYLYNQWTDFHKISCVGKPQIRAIHKYVGYIKVITNN